MDRQFLLEHLVGHRNYLQQEDHVQLYRSKEWKKHLCEELAKLIEELSKEEVDERGHIIFSG